jgi:hypothetical protein
LCISSFPLCSSSVLQYRFDEMAVFSVAPEARDFTLTITDLANPQAGQSANVEL